MSDLKLPDLNKVLLAGRLTRDPELRYINSGTAVCKMGLAVSRYFKNRDGQRQEETFYINVQAWSKLAEFCGEHLRKGRPIMVEGQLRSNEWDDKQTGQKRTTIEVNALSVQTLDWKDDGRSQNNARPGGNESRKEKEPEFDDDIPF